MVAANQVPASAGEVVVPTPWLDRIVRWWPILLGLGAAILALILQAWCGWSWDESYYLKPARLTQNWMVIELTHRNGGTSENIAKYWGGPEVVGQEDQINELPGMCKFLWAVGIAMFEGVFGTQAAMRVPSAIMFGALTALIGFLGQAYGRTSSGVIAALAFLSMPQVWGFATLATTELPMAFFALATCAALLLAVERPKTSWLVGALFGCAIATKINGFFLFPTLYFWGWVYTRERIASPAFAMMLLGPIVFVLCWPWLWTDTIARILEYLSFHATHQETPVYYMNRAWGAGRGPGAPWHYPFVVLGVTTPLVVLGFILLGAMRSAMSSRDKWSGMLLIQSLWPLLLIAVPGQPKYDGVRLFFPAYPFLALLVGAAVEGMLRLFDAPKRPGAMTIDHDRLARARRGTTWIAAALVVGSGLWGMYQALPFPLSYFNELVGGDTPQLGAWESGYETTWWGETIDHHVIAWLNDPQNVPDDATIKTRAMFPRMLTDAQDLGQLRPSLRIDPPEPDGGYQFHVIYARRGFWGEFDKQLYSRLGKARHVFYHGGAPTVMIFGPIDEIFEGPLKPMES